MPIPSNAMTLGQGVVPSPQHLLSYQHSVPNAPGMHPNLYMHLVPQTQAPQYGYYYSMHPNNANGHEAHPVGGPLQSNDKQSSKSNSGNSNKTNE